MADLQDFLIKRAVSDLINKRISLYDYYNLVNAILACDDEVLSLWKNYENYLQEYLVDNNKNHYNNDREVEK